MVRVHVILRNLIMYKCVCNREFDNPKSYASHTKFCKVYCKDIGRVPFKPWNGARQKIGQVAWNKGLSGDERTFKYKDLLRYLKSKSIDYANYGRNIQVMAKLDRRYWDLFIELNDDNKLGKKILNKMFSNSIGHSINCELSQSDFLDLMKEANIKSSNWSQGHYDLSRIGDKGPYSKSNCSFKTHKDNMKELFENSQKE